MKKRLSVIALLLALVMMLSWVLTACNNQDPNDTEGPGQQETDPNDDKTDPDDSKTDPEPEPEILVPSQDGLPEGVEYQFTGEYDTGVMGVGTVIGNFYYDQTFDVIASLFGMYEVGLAWGDHWDFEDGQLVMTGELENGDPYNAVATGEGNVYTFIVPFSGTDIEMTAVMNGEKSISELHKDPNPKENGDDPTLPAEKILLLEASEVYVENMASPDGTAVVLRFYSDGTCTADYISTDSRETIMSGGDGTWEYTDGALKITDGSGPVEIAYDEGVYAFVATFSFFSRKFEIEKSYLEECIENGGSPLVAAEIVDRYKDYTDEQWNNVWTDTSSDSAGENPFVPSDYGKTGIDSLFLEKLPKEYFTPVAEADRGTVTRLNYETYTYSYYQAHNTPEAEWKTVNKTCYVYLPAGYSADEQYNVFYLMHGAGGDETNWFSMCLKGFAQNGGGDFVVLVDYLIAQGLMEPTIFVSATTNTDVSGLDKDIQMRYSVADEMLSFPFELENDLIPAVEGKYSTYAENVTHEGLVASRNHRAFGGLSMGAFVVWNTIPETLDVVAYFAPLANGCDNDTDNTEVTVAEMYESLTTGVNANYDVGFIFAGCGVHDHTWNSHMRTVEALLAESAKDAAGGKFTYGENFYSYNPEYGTHSATYFIIGVYNAMQIIFAK